MRGGLCTQAVIISHPCKGTRILESRKFLLVESGIRENFSGLCNSDTAQGIQDPCSTDKDWDAAPGIRNPRRGIPNLRLHSSSARLRYFFISHKSRDIFQKFEGKSVENTVEPLGTYGHLANTDTPLLQTVSNVPTKLSYILFKRPSSIRTLANTDNGH